MRHNSRLLGLLVIAGTLVLLCGCTEVGLDRQLDQMVEANGLQALDPGPEHAPELFQLGEALFFDKELSGNRDTACATCHHPTEHGSDGLSLPVGTGGEGLGADRQLGQGREFVPRNSPEIFNRGASEWVTMFWDGRVATTDNGFVSPAGTDLPDGLDSVLAVQAMFPVTSRDEMRGNEGDRGASGALNELAAVPADDLPAIWDGLMDRLLRIEGYTTLFAAAYPELTADELGFQHAANAIAAYEADAFAFAVTPWDAYLAGDHGALAGAAKRGAILFFGDAGCSLCHSGSLLTDQGFHNVAVPQLGPGKGEEAPADLGRARVSGDPADNCAFRTAPLRNVALTGPWMHDGAYTDLESAVRHMAGPVSALRAYDPGALRPDLQNTVRSSPEDVDVILVTLDPYVAVDRDLSNGDVKDLLAFLGALTDPAAANLTSLTPDSVPSGQPVDR
jgi:cytochrome c peroxidase